MDSVHSASNPVVSPISTLGQLSEIALEGGKLADLFHAMELGIDLSPPQPLKAVQPLKIEENPREHALRDAAREAGLIKQFTIRSKKWEGKHKARRDRVEKMADQKKFLERGKISHTRDKPFKLGDFFDYLDGFTPLSQADLSSILKDIDQTIRKDLQDVLKQAKKVKSSVDHLLNKPGHHIGQESWRNLIQKYGAKDPLTSATPLARRAELREGLIKAYEAVQRTKRENEGMLDDSEIEEEIKNLDFPAIVDGMVKEDFDKAWARLALFNHFSEQKALHNEPTLVDGEVFYSFENDYADQVMDDVERALNYPSLIQYPINFFIERMKIKVQETEYQDILKDKLIKQLEISSESPINLEAITKSVNAEIATNPIKAALRYGLFQNEIQHTALEIQEKKKIIYNDALEEAKSSMGVSCMRRVEQMLPDNDAGVQKVFDSIYNELLSKQAKLDEMIHELEKTQAGLATKDQAQAKGFFQQIFEAGKNRLFGNPVILTDVDKQARKGTHDEKYYADALRLLKIFHFGDINSNIQMGSSLLQSLRAELLNRPSLEKLNLMRDISLLYAQAKTGGDAIQMLRSELEHSVILDTLMGKNLPSIPLSGDMKRLAGLVEQTQHVFTTYQGFSRMPMWLAPVAYAVGANPITSLLLSGAAIFSNYRTIDHLKASHEALSENQKKEIITFFIQMDNLANNVDKLYEGQINTKLYRIVNVRRSGRSIIGRIKHKVKRFKLEMKYASTTEKVVRVAHAFFTPVMFLLDTTAFVTAFTALSVASFGTTLVTGRKAAESLFESAKSAYVLNRKSTDVINSIYKDTHDKVMRELKERRFIKHWNKKLLPQINKLAEARCREGREPILEGAHDKQICEYYQISLGDWQDKSPDDKLKFRHLYFNTVFVPQIRSLLNNVAIRIYAESSNVSITEPMANVLLSEIEKVYAKSSEVDDLIKLFLDDWELHKKNPGLSMDERKQKIVKDNAGKPNTYNLSQEEINRNHALFNDMNAELKAAYTQNNSGSTAV